MGESVCVVAYPNDEPMKNKHTEVIINVIKSFVRHLFVEVRLTFFLILLIFERKEKQTISNDRPSFVMITEKKKHDKISLKEKNTTLEFRKHITII